MRRENIPSGSMGANPRDMRAPLDAHMVVATRESGLVLLEFGWNVSHRSNYALVGQQVSGPKKIDPNFAPGSHGCHEALHMTSFLISAIDNELCEHEAIKANKEWRKLAVLAAESLERLYSAIGKDHIRSASETQSVDFPH
jgi:hypothetical protein